jgi:hypothetical protein
MLLESVPRHHARAIFIHAVHYHPLHLRVNQAERAVAPHSDQLRALHPIAALLL